MDGRDCCKVVSQGNAVGLTLQKMDRRECRRAISQEKILGLILQTRGTGEYCRVVSLANRWDHFPRASEHFQPSEASVVLGATPEEQKDDCCGEH